MASLSQFSRRISLRATSISDRVDNLVRKVALAADQAVVMGTPVDTGRARSNWIVQLGSASSAVVDSYGPGAAQAALSQAEAVISNYRNGQAIHITNNLPYIQRLNEGWSAQAPAAFVETAVLEAVRLIGRGRIVSDLPGG